MRAKRPIVLRVTVLPPVFGPVTISVLVSSGTSTSMGTAFRPSKGVARAPQSHSGNAFLGKNQLFPLELDRSGKTGVQIRKDNSGGSYGRRKMPETPCRFLENPEDFSLQSGLELD